jgi:hypothetical protein
LLAGALILLKAVFFKQFCVSKLYAYRGKVLLGFVDVELAQLEAQLLFILNELLPPRTPRRCALHREDTSP